MSAKKRPESRDLIDFHFQMALDFVDQCEREMDKRGWTQKDVAERLGTSEGYISQVFGNPSNLTLKTIAKLARIFHQKATVVMYNDARDDGHGPLSSRVFIGAWERLDKPSSACDIKEV